MATNEEQIRALIERWAAAVHRGDMRCATPEELARHPERRLRLTLGLRKEHGRWVVAHEHHSFPDASGAG